MRLKKELYKREQDDIVRNIINILELDEENSITLYELDNNLNKQKQIMDLIPVIRKYFSFSCIMGAKEPENLKRPYLSLVKNITKPSYNIYNADCRVMIDNKKIRTTKYVFIKKMI